eukprot:jgi/Mesvir1/865/Mv17436-RA.1
MTVEAEPRPRDDAYEDTMPPEAVLLKREKDRLENALAHLERSNREIDEELQKKGPDQELADAIQENVVIMGGMRQHVAQLAREIQELTQAARDAAGMAVGGTRPNQGSEGEQGGQGGDSDDQAMTEAGPEDQGADGGTWL